MKLVTLLIGLSASTAVLAQTVPGTVPEPETLGLIGAAVAAGVFAAWKRKRK